MTSPTAVVSRVMRSPTSPSTPSSSSISRLRASLGDSPYSTFPPGNSHRPAEARPAARLQASIVPSSRTATAATTSMVFTTQFYLLNGRRSTSNGRARVRSSPPPHIRRRAPTPAPRASPPTGAQRCSRHPCADWRAASRARARRSPWEGGRAHRSNARSSHQRTLRSWREGTRGRAVPDNARSPAGRRRSDAHAGVVRGAQRARARCPGDRNGPCGGAARHPLPTAPLPESSSKVGT